MIPPPTPPSTTRARVAGLLDSLREAGAHEQAAALADRAAAHAPLDDPARVASLLDSLRRQARTSRPPRWPTGPPPTPLPSARQASRSRRPRLASLLDSLREAGAHEQAAALADRLPAAGMFGLFLKQKGLADRVPFRTGGRRHPGRAMGLGRPGLMACSPAAETGDPRRSTERGAP